LSLSLSDRLYVTPHIRYVWMEDRVVILDLKTESYFALDPTASYMWRELCRGRTHDECLNVLAGLFPDDRPRLGIDFDAFANRCVEAGWLVRTVTAPPQEAHVARIRKPGRQFLTIRAWWALVCVTISLSWRGFSRTYADAISASKSRPVVTDDLEDVLSRGVAAFARAEEFFYLKAAPADCLPRSLALFRILRATGLPVEHCIGVQQFPFTAHAWAQFRGGIIHDDPENQNRYTVIARISP
jgi:hypothetical protein